MSLPKRPPLSNPIPNADIPNVPRQYSVKAPYWDAIVSGDLAVSEDGTLTLPNGIGSGDPNTQVQASWWSMPIGSGLTVDEQGFLVPNNYIYCTPAHPSLPPSDPPYDCETEVNTAGVTDFEDAWNGCNLTDPLPCVDTSSGQYFYQAFRGNDWESFPTLNFSSGTYFGYTWADNANLTELPFVNVSNGENFEGAWYNCISFTSFPKLDFSSAKVLGDIDNINYGAWENCNNLETFPKIDTSNVEKFDWAWNQCTSLVNFPEIDTSSGVEFYATWSNNHSSTSFPLLNFSSAVNLEYTWENCYNLVDFPSGVFDNCTAINFAHAWELCALSQQSVDNILVSLDTAGQSNGIVNIDGGTSSAPGAAGLAAKSSLEEKGWTVTTN